MQPQPMPGQPTPEEAQFNAAIFTKMILDKEASKKRLEADTAKADPKPEPKKAKVDAAEEVIDKIEEQRAKGVHHVPHRQHQGFLPWLAHKLNLR